MLLQMKILERKIVMEKEVFSKQLDELKKEWKETLPEMKYFLVIFQAEK